MLLHSKSLTIQYGHHTIPLGDMVLEDRQHTLLLGASGTGKTSLLLCLAGLLSPTSGSVTINGQNLYALPESKRDAFRAAHIGIVFQTLHLLPDLTAKQNILLGAKENRNTLMPISNSLGIAALMHRKPHQLSHGQAQRVAIARALIAQPQILLADEPTAALDDANTEAVATLLLETAAQCGTTLLVATHDARLKPYFQHEVCL